MKIFAIVNEDNPNSVNAYLFYYERQKTFYIELSQNADEWNTPFILSSFAKRNIKTVDFRWSKIWAEQRVIPSDRQNLAQILKDNNLDNYDVFKLLMLAKGRCAQDNYHLQQIDWEQLPLEIKRRKDKEVTDVFAIDEENILVFFQNGIIKKCNLSKISHNNPSINILLKKYPKSVKEVRIQVGGHGVMWDENIIITNETLYKHGQTIPLSNTDFVTFATERMVNADEAAQMLNCSRQNINDLTKRNKLCPVKRQNNKSIFQKSDIEKREWV